MATTDEMIPIAEAVIAKASVLDTRFIRETRDLELMVQSWAEVFAVNGMWRFEALKAVAEHYAQDRAFPIMPGDIIARVNAMPCTSSPERLLDWLRKWSHYPNSTAIQEMSGMEWKPGDAPPEVAEQGADAVNHYHRKQFQLWIQKNLNEIQSAILANSKSGSIRAIGR